MDTISFAEGGQSVVTGTHSYSEAQHSHSTHRPVVVEVTQLVCQPLQVVRFESRGVGDDVVVGGAHCALTDTLTHNKEVVPSTSDEGEKMVTSRCMAHGNTLNLC